MFICFSKLRIDIPSLGDEQHCCARERLFILFQKLPTPPSPPPFFYPSTGPYPANLLNLRLVLYAHPA